MRMVWQRVVLVLSCFVLGSVLMVRPVLADYNEARLAYQTEYSKYRELFVKYNVAKSEYLTYKTLISRTQALAATQEFLLSRQQLLQLYLDMLNFRLDQAINPYLLESDVATIRKQISDNKAYLEKRNAEIENAGELADLSTVSALVDKRISQIEAIGYHIEGLIILSHAKEMMTTESQLVAITSDQVNRITNEGKKDTTDLQRWIIDAQAKFQFATTSHEKAITLSAKVSSRKTFENLRNEIVKSRQYVKETNKILLEIIRNIKITG